MKTHTELKRHLNHWQCGALALGCMIGWGCFILPGDFLATAGPIGATIGIAVGGLLMAIVSYSHGVMVTRFPFAGGEFVYAYFAGGPHHAYACGWFLALGYLCIIPLNATALALLGKFVLPDVFARGYLYSVAGFDVYLGEIGLASAAIVGFGWLNHRGIKLVGRSQLLLLVIMVAAIVLIAFGSVFDPHGSLTNLTPAFAIDSSAIGGILAIVAIAPWMLSGFDTLPQAAEELTFSTTKAYRLMLFSIVIGVILYIAVVLATAYLMPWTETVDASSAWATGFVVDYSLGRMGLAILSLGVMMGVFTGINGFFMAVSRLMFSMSRANILPEWFGQLSPSHGTPSNAILFAVTVSLLAPWFGRQALLWVVDMSAVGIAVGFLYTCIAACVLLANRSPEDHAQGNRALAILGAIVSTGFLLLLCIPGTPAFMATPSWIALGCWVLLGATCYLPRVSSIKKMNSRELDSLVLGDQYVDDSRRPF